MNTLTATKKISLLRHAKSDWGNPGVPDHDRPLNARGRRSAPLIAQYIQGQQIGVDVILVSTALRAQQTLELLVAAWPERVPTVFSKQNLYLATPQAILQEIAKLDEQWNSAMVIGHNPGLGDLACLFAEKALEYPTACLSAFSVRVDRWEDITMPELPRAELIHYCRPRELE